MMQFDEKRLAAATDHTLLDPCATWDEICALCDDAISFGAASVCIPPVYVAPVKEYVGESARICTVIGFPNGYAATAVKLFEAEQAIGAGADEIDMVIQLGWLKAGRDEAVLEEICAMRKVCAGKILKVIIETCLLTQEEKLRMCEIVTKSGADFIKTSTGFSAGGATAQDVTLLAANVGSGVKVKASGGISSLSDASRLLDLGAERLGSSKVIKLIKHMAQPPQEGRNTNE